MHNENYYLQLLDKLVKELNYTNNKKDEYPPCVYNCILAGIIIRMNSIIDQCMLDFHSENFTLVAEAIYSARQLLVHYSDFRTFSDISKLSETIIKKFNKAYNGEKKYFSDILKFDDCKERNVVVAKSKNVIYDEFTNSYVFIGDNVEISVSKDRVTTIQDFYKKRDIAYIINCEGSMNYFYRNENYETIYQELNDPLDLQDFFKYHFKVIDRDYNKHRECIKDIINNFYKKGSYSSVYVNTSEEGKKKPLYTESSKLLNAYFNNGVVYKQFLNERVFSNMGVPENEYIDYHHIKDNCKNDLEKNISKRDYFFVIKTISIFDNINAELKRNSYLCDEQKQMMKMAMLINWADRTFRKMSEEFVNCNEEFKKLHLKLLSYRTFFAHNILQQKPAVGERILEEFYDLARGYVSILSSLNIEYINEESKRKMVDFVAIERTPSHFVNSKHEQYIQVDPTTYIGNKLFYSTRGSEYRKIIGLVPVDKAFSLRGTYYEKKGEEFVAKTFKSKSGKSHNLLVSKLNYSKGKEVSVDVNIDDLLFVFAANKGKIKEFNTAKLDNPSHKKVILFNPCQENDFKRHATCFDDVIFNYYQQRYLPFELAKPTKLGVRYTEDKKMYFTILDLDNNEIAYVIDSNELVNFEMEKDKKGFFTINETVCDFTKRRSKK